MDFDKLNKVGRAQVKVERKGEAVVKAFADATTLLPEEREQARMGPGAYDIAAKPGIGHSNSRVKGAVAMDRVVARADAVGPNGGGS